MNGAPPAVPSWTRSPWVKWSWLIVLGVIVAQSLDYHWRRLPTTAAGYFSRGRADYLLGEYESAIENFARSIELDSTDAEGYIWRGEAYAKLRDFDRAMPDLAKALALRPDYAKAHAAMADGKAAAWDVDGAIAEYTQAIERDPIYGRCYFQRGQMLYDSGRHREAADDLRRAASLLVGDNQINAQLLLWLARARAGDPAGATRELARILGLGTIRQNRFWNGGHFLCGDISEAAYLKSVAGTQADGQDDARAEAYFLAGEKRFVSGDPAGALPLLRNALATQAQGSYGFERARVALAGELLGFQPSRVDDGLAIASVRPGGPAETAGIKVGAVFATIDGKQAGQDQFVALLGSAEPGSTVELQFVDPSGSRRRVELSIRLGSSAPTR
jgi:tetratricopeptide (TPR) repeat protein